MALIHERSTEVLLPELDLFAIPPTQLSIIKTKHSVAGLQTALSYDSPLEFSITSGQSYIDLDTLQLYLKEIIYVEDINTVIPPTIPNAANDGQITNPKSRVFPVNTFLSAQFSNLEVSLNDRQIYTSENQYAYRSYFDFLFGNNTASKRKAELQMFYEHTNGYLDSNFRGINGGVNANAEINGGAVSRFQRTQNSRKFECMGPIYFDLCGQGRLLPPNNTLKIRFIRNNPKFALMAENENETYKIIIHEAQIFYRSKEVNPNISSAHRLLGENEPYQYPLRKTEVRYQTHQARSNNLSVNSFYSGTLPRRVTVCNVLSKAFHGHLNFDPFNFQAFDIKSAVLRVNGENTPYTENLVGDPPNGLYGEFYYSFLSAYGLINNSEEVGINYKSFKEEGNFFISFDLSPSGVQNPHYELMKDGSINIELLLGAETEHGVVTLFFLEWDNLLSVFTNENNKKIALVN
jgi:hypothetical protein